MVARRHEPLHLRLEFRRLAFAAGRGAFVESDLHGKKSRRAQARVVRAGGDREKIRRDRRGVDRGLETSRAKRAHGRAAAARGAWTETGSGVEKTSRRREGARPRAVACE